MPAASTMELVTPLAGATDVSPATALVLKLVDGDDDAPVLDTVAITVNGLEIWADEEPQNGWNAVTTEVGADLFYYLYPPNGFSYAQTITIETNFEAAAEFRTVEEETVTVSDAWTLELSSNTLSYLGLFGVLTGAPVYSVITTTTIQTSED